VDAQRYDRARPPYPDALVGRVVVGSPGGDVLDVGCGTGIAARQFQAAGCAVLGIEPDERMADFARASGVPVEVARFEDWRPAGRAFDVVAAAQSWHWVDPGVGAAKAAQVLRPRGLLAIFSHVYEPPVEVAEPFAAAFRKAVPDSPFAGAPARRPLATYQVAYQAVTDQIRQSGRFGEPEQWQFDWERTYNRDEWLDLLPTTGGLTTVPPDTVEDILQAVGTAIDALGGHFTMSYTTLAVIAGRADAG
jgi:SAM-dependent methyltransferase